MHTLVGFIPGLRLKIPTAWRAVLAVLLSGCYTWASAPLEPEFSSQTHSIPGVVAGSLAWADFDNDGDLDVFVSGAFSDGQWASSLSRIYRNDSGSFANTGIVLPGYRSSSADWTDFNNDGFVDLVVSGISDFHDAGTRVFRNIGGSNLVQVALLPGVSDGRAAWGDFNQDGFADLAITGLGITNGAPFGPFTRLFVNNGGTNFTQAVVLSPETYYGTVDWADYDHDGRLDLLATGEEIERGGAVRIYRNEGDRFTSPGSIISLASSVRGQWLDANNDGWADLLILVHSMANSFVMLNNGAGGFTRGSDLGMLGTYAVGDCNNDGFSDALFVGYRYSREIGNFVYTLTSLYLNSSTNTWLERTNLLVHLRAAAAAWGDYDRDGRLDLILQGLREDDNQLGYFTYLYRNVTARTNEAPGPPGDLRASVQGDRVLLSWSAAMDPNQNGGLTYNVRVGSAPGRGDIVNSMSAPEGWRRVVKRGNADGRTFYALRGLQSRQTYYWSVQAVDNAFSGSAFAPEMVFIFNGTPQASNQVVMVNEDTARTLTLAGSDPEGDTLTYSVLSGPTNGALTGIPPNLVYTPKTNFYGQDAFHFQVSDGLTGSPPATVNITVLPVNDPPVADASATRTLWISGNGTNAAVTLDGSRSSDIDGDGLGYLWRTSGRTNTLATGEIAVAQLPVGTNFIELLLGDGVASDTNVIRVEIIMTTEALRRLIITIAAQVTRTRPLMNSLASAIASLNRGHSVPAMKRLEAFQNQVRAQVAPGDPALANELIAEAQAVVEAIVASGASQTGRVGKLMLRKDNSGTRMEFEAAAAHIYMIETSSNLTDWTTIGVARERAPNLFEFQDPNSAQFPNRFYRVVAP